MLPGTVGPSIGGNIAEALRQYALTQAELARRLKVPQPTVNGWVKNRFKSITLKNLLSIAAAIPCPVDVLVKGVDEKYDEQRDLTRHADSENRGGGVGDPDATRLLEQERAKTRAIGDDLHEVIRRLTLIAAKAGTHDAAGPEGHAIGARAAGRSEGDRTARRRRAR